MKLKKIFFYSSFYPVNPAILLLLLLLLLFVFLFLSLFYFFSVPSVSPW